MRTKGSDSRGSDKDLADPEFVHLQRAGGGPEDHSSSCIDIVCPFRAPPLSWFPLLLRRMALQPPVGFLDYRSLGFLHLKVSDVAQRLPIHPLSNAVERWKTVQLCTSVRQKNMGAVVGSGSDNWSYKQWPNRLDQSSGATDWQGDKERSNCSHSGDALLLLDQQHVKMLNSKCKYLNMQYHVCNRCFQHHMIRKKHNLTSYVCSTENLMWRKTKCCFFLHIHILILRYKD